MVHYLTKYIYIYIYMCIYILIKKICNAFIYLHFNTWWTQTRVSQMGSTGRGRQFGHEFSKLSHMAMLVMSKLTFCRQMSIASPS